MKTRALLLALPLVALSCREGTQSIQIQQVCYPTDDCVFSSSCDLGLLGNPRIDVGGASSSVGLFLQVANQLQDNSDDDIRVNTNDAHVDEIEVEYTGVAIPAQTSLTNQRVPANSTNIVKVFAIPAGFDAALDAVAGRQVLALVTMRGYYDDETRFETAEFPIAIDVCAGCVGSCVTAEKPEVCGGNDAQHPKTCFDPTGAGST